LPFGWIEGGLKLEIPILTSAILGGGYKILSLAYRDEFNFKQISSGDKTEISLVLKSFLFLVTM
jgi:hypothetical protein